MQQVLAEEFTAIVGPKHARLGAGRIGNWHGVGAGYRRRMVVRRRNKDRPRAHTRRRGQVQPRGDVAGA
ncbi:MAG: hypothetical protein M3Q82_09110 [Actinomycetota bacterium]|nr:hypothetical protein [Actinomycetota bacterium]